MEAFLESPDMLKLEPRKGVSQLVDEATCEQNNPGEDACYIKAVRLELS